jgi:hypothetical protein
MSESIHISLNDPRFGSPEAKKYWWHHAFIFRSTSTIHPALHMSTVTTPDGKMTICPVSGDADGPDMDQAIGVARQLVQEGVNKIDLCSGFNAEWAKQIQEALGDTSEVSVCIRADQL